MRFNIVIALSLLCTLVSGLAVSSRLSERQNDLRVRRQLLLEDIAELVIRGSKIKGKYTVPAGGGKSSQTYSRKDVKNAVKAANGEHQRHKSGTMSNTQKKKSLLQPFSNNNHQVPKAGAAGPNSLPKMKGKGYEYPLRNKAQGPASSKDKGPARVITQEDNRGKLRFKGVVAHDQSRPLPAPGTKAAPGTHDHFQVKGQRK